MESYVCFALEQVRSILEKFGKKSWKLLAAEQSLSDNMIKSALKTFNKDVLQQFPTIDINLSSVLFDIHNKKSKILLQRTIQNTIFVRKH